MCVYIRVCTSPVSASTCSQQLGVTLVCVISTLPLAWHIVVTGEYLLNTTKGGKVDIWLLGFTICIY